MNLTYLILEVVCSTIAGYLFAKILIHYSIKHSLLDEANARSSHKHPTPRIGGISFVVLVSSILIGSYILKLYNFDLNVYLILLVPPLFVAAISIVDDIKGGISRLKRLLCHFIAIGVALYLLKMPSDNLLQIALILALFFGAVW